MSLANHLENSLLNTLRNVSFAVAAVHVKLHIGDPGEDATGNPAANTTRQAVTFAAAASGSMASSANVTWTSVSTTETYSHISLWDASTAGNPLWKGALTASKAVTAGDTFQIPSGSLVLSLD